MATSLVEARPDHAPFVAWVVMTAFRSHLERGMPALQKGVAEATSDSAARRSKPRPAFGASPRCSR
jgi:hypothetical protein